MIRNSVPSPLEPSKRGVQNLELGKLVNFRNLTEGKTRYNPETNPSGLINLSGSENEGMGDYLEQYTKDLLDDFNLTKSRLFFILFRVLVADSESSRVHYASRITG
jgi:hypothetical protein